MVRRDSKAILATVAAGISLAVCVSVAMADQCTGSRKLGMSWTERSATVKISVSGTHCPTVPACVGVISTGAEVLTVPPFTLTVVDALGLTYETTLDIKDPLCGRLCTSAKRGSCPAGTETYWGVGSRRLRYSFGNLGEVILLATKFTLPSVTQPSITAPVTTTITDANGYSLVLKSYTCLSRQRLGSWSVKCY